MITPRSWGDNQAANTNEIQIWNIKLVFGKVFYFGSNLQHHLSLLLITMNSCPWHGSLSKGTKAKCFYQFRYRRTDCTDNCLPSLISFLYVCGRESMPVWPALQWYIVITTHSQLWLLQGTLGKSCTKWTMRLAVYIWKWNVWFREIVIGLGGFGDYSILGILDQDDLYKELTREAVF